MKISLTVTLLALTYCAFAQTTTTAFLGIQLGQTESTFLINYSDASSHSDHMLYLNGTIDHKDMVLHNVTKTTSSGEPVSIDCYFKNQKLVVIEVEYMKYQYDNTILKALAAAHGMYSKSKVYSYTDPLNNQKRTEAVITWTQPKNSILEYDDVDELGHPHFTIADKQTQNGFLQLTKKNTMGKIQ